LRSFAGPHDPLGFLQPASWLPLAALHRRSRPFTADRGPSPPIAALHRRSRPIAAPRGGPPMATWPFAALLNLVWPTSGLWGLSQLFQLQCPRPTAASAIVCARLRPFTVLFRSWTILYSSRPFVAPRSFSRTNSCDGTLGGVYLCKWNLERGISLYTFTSGPLRAFGGFRGLPAGQWRAFSSRVFGSPLQFAPRGTLWPRSQLFADELPR
jgi:hypothetical protein